MPHQGIIDRIMPLLQQLDGKLPEECDPVIDEVREKLKWLRGYDHGEPGEDDK